MLKLVHSPVRSAAPDAHITLPPDTPHEDHKRFAGLAAVFYGHHIPHKATWVFTEVRGTKCWLLYQHGFEGLDRRGNEDRDCITHPKDKKRYSISRAVACCRLMEPAEPVIPAGLTVGVGEEIA